MKNSNGLVRSIASGEAVRQRLMAALYGLEITWEGDNHLPEMEEKLRQGEMFATPGLRMHFHTTRPRDWQKGTGWWSAFMPPVEVYWWCRNLMWRVAIVDAGRPVSGEVIRTITQPLIKELLQDSGYWSPEVVIAPCRYSELSLARSTSRAWLALQLLPYCSSQTTRCEHCGHATVEYGDIDQLFVAFVTGVDATVVQTDWVVYQSVVPDWRRRKKPIDS